MRRWRRWRICECVSVGYEKREDRFLREENGLLDSSDKWAGSEQKWWWGSLTLRQFTRSGYHLMRLQLGEDLTHLRYGNMSRRIASVEELLAVRPELRSAAQLLTTVATSKISDDLRCRGDGRVEKCC
jgi:hypothetical protein